jgi:hypothetical protein
MYSKACAFFGLFGLVALAISCDEQVNLVSPPAVDNPITLKFAESATLTSENLEIMFEAVNTDSRCPINVLCFWAGMAEIQLRVIMLPADTHRVAVPMIGSGSLTESRQQMPVDTLGYRFTLLNLLPYPHTDSTYEESDYVATLSIVSHVPTDSADGEVIITDADPRSFQVDPYRLDRVSIDDHVINITVTYSGGCKNHYFQLFMSPAAFMESYPAQANLYLRHFADFDPCDAIVTRDLAFDLQPVAHLYELMYGDLDPIRLNLFEYFETVPGRKVSVMYHPDGIEPSEMLPMAVGNYWVYAETTWTMDGIAARLDSIEVIGRHHDDLGQWWVLRSPFPWLEDTVMVRNDTVFSRTYGWPGLFMSVEYIPAADTPFNYMVIRGDIGYTRTVSPVDSVVTVPAGSYGESYMYTGREGPFSEPFSTYPYRLFLAPGVGFIFFEQHDDSAIPENTFTQRAWLIRYHIE